MLVATLALSLVGLGYGCSRAEPNGASSSARPAPSLSAGVVDFKLDPGGPAYADEDLAVPADFEAEAERDITPESYRAELEAIEQELDASAPDAAARSDAATKPDAGTRGDASARGKGRDIGAGRN